MKISLKLVSMAVLVGGGFAGSMLHAAEHEVRLLNRGEAGAMIFEPAVLHIAPGDTVTFISADRGHNVETIKGMLPDGAEPFASPINEDFTISFAQEGVWGVKCAPHYSMGMVGLIVVGTTPDNIEAAMDVRHPRSTKARMDSLFEELDLHLAQAASADENDADMSDGPDQGAGEEAQTGAEDNETSPAE